MSRERLILFTRFPVAGRAKTRLIPCLGADGAAQLQREMTEHVLARVWPLAPQHATTLEVRFEGGSAADMRRWLGRGLRFAPQGDGDLGARMHRASTEAFDAGAQAVVIIGADCPEVDAVRIQSAFQQLRAHRLVLGPARDGGYYLIGLSAATPELFAGIPWGTREVLTASVARARSVGLEPFLLPEAADVDEPADLAVWEKARQESRRVSVIIPTLNEAAHLPMTIEYAAAGPSVELIVADGGSRDDTLRIAQAHGARTVSGRANRAHQMNAGATVASGETLLFLHADTWLPENWQDLIQAALRQPGVVGGAFRFRIREPFRGRRFIENAVNVRSRLWRMPYGDQALFVRRWAFDASGGFPELPIMEDYECVRRLGRLGRLALLDAAVLTSGRRWQRLGVVHTTWINRLVILGYHCGVSPARLAALYRGRKAYPQPVPAQPADDVRSL